MLPDTYLASIWSVQDALVVTTFQSSETVLTLTSRRFGADSLIVETTALASRYPRVPFSAISTPYLPPETVYHWAPEGRGCSSWSLLIPHA